MDGRNNDSVWVVFASNGCSGWEVTPDRVFRVKASVGYCPESDEKYCVAANRRNRNRYPGLLERGSTDFHDRIRLELYRYGGVFGAAIREKVQHLRHWWF